MDILFDKIPETAVNNELYGMKLLSEKAVRLWNSWSKDMPASWFFEKYNALVDRKDHLNDLDFLVDTYVLEVIKENENNLEIFNPILEFVMVAREAGLQTNRMTS
tara:strand:- start:374 stop:688 length:315 start_codon:yes stop_codon:yes gene_type:complete